MRCKNCGYRLWNLVSRECPECGQVFAPSQFEFAPRSVQFCCPQCRTPYLGEGPRGHLWPAQFECTGCGRPAHMDEMVLLPAEGIDEEATEVVRIPWLDRPRLSWPRAWIRTVRWSMTRPGELIRTVPLNAELGDSVQFAVLTIGLASGAWFGLLVILLLLPMGGAGAAAWVCGSGVAFVVALIVLILVSVALIGIWGYLAHLLLRSTGRTAGPFARTCTALCYSAGANVLGAIPFVPYLGWVWWLVSAVLMVRAGQNVSTRRALFAVLTGPLLLLLAAGLATWITSESMASARRTAQQTIAQHQTEVVFQAVRQFAERHQRWPHHAVELMVESLAGFHDLFPNSVETASVRVGNTDLALFEGLLRLEQVKLARELIRSLPEDVVAHRLGEFVFTYHGVNPQDAGDLWLCIHEAPNPGAPNAMRVMTQRRSQWLEMNREALRAQNELRARRGLGPLPLPRFVKHGHPATAAGEPSHSETGDHDEPDADLGAAARAGRND